jgi:hypothetical protein
MTPDRVGLRLSADDRRDLEAIARALDGTGERLPWLRASVATCLRTALKQTAETARAGGITGP